MPKPTNKPGQLWITKTSALCKNSIPNKKITIYSEKKDINIATKIPEFERWKWVEMQKIPDLIVPFKKELYQDIVIEFENIV